MGNEQGIPLKGQGGSAAGFNDSVTVYQEKKYTLEELQQMKAHFDARLQDLEQHMRRLGQNNMAGYIHEYTTIAEGRGEKATHSALPQHREFNRYQNIVAYDHTRVALAPNPSTHNSDYINANYVSGFGKDKMYIAAQGPVPKSVDGFWQMIWENNVPTIVMVTNLVEGNPSKLKCHRYWPDPNLDNGNPKATYGNFEVEYVSQEQDPTYLVRTFQVKNKKNGQKRTLKHFHYIAWPDHGVPETAKEMLKFRSVVKDHHTADKAGQMVVHCSAGVGRTGTFIGLDRYLDSAVALDDTLSVLDVVRNMRASRNYMVQAQAQFIYLYEAAREGLLKLQEKIDRELQMYDLAKQVEEAETKEAAQEAHEDLTAQVLSEIATDLQSATSELQANVQRGRRDSFQIDTTPKQPHASGRKDVVGHFKDDIATTDRLKGNERKSSLAASTELWVKRKNVPMSIQEHGYVSDRSAPLTSRLMALSEARTAWMTRYTDAERTWQAEQDMEGVVYDVKQQLTPLESRVGSLAASEEAWKLGANATSAKDEMLNKEISDLTTRLESLQFTVLNMEKRWRTKGEGFAKSTDLITQEKRADTVGQLGNLTDRLMTLQTSQTEWLKRKNWESYEVQQFHDQIMAAVEEQENLRAQLEKKELALEQARLTRIADLKKERESKTQFDKHKKSEAQRREKAKRKALEITSRKEEYIPLVAAQKKSSAAAKKAEKEAAKVAAQKAELQKKENAKAKKASTTSAADRKKNKFLNSQKK